MDVNAPRGILRFFADMEDPRAKQGRRHELLDILVSAICAVICGADGWEDVALFGRSKQKWFATFLRLPHGIPSHDTFGRVFARLDPDVFEQRFLAWVRHLAQASVGRLEPRLPPQPTDPRARPENLRMRLPCGASLPASRSIRFSHEAFVGVK